MATPKWLITTYGDTTVANTIQGLSAPGPTNLPATDKSHNKWSRK